MRIDLGSQCLQFKLFQRNLILINLMDQTVDLVHHASEAAHQKTNFISGIAVHRNLTAALVYPVHVIGKLLDLSGKKSGKRKSQHQNYGYTGRNQGNLADQDF